MIENFFNRYSFVRQIPIFSKLNWIDLQKIARRVIIAEYKKGEMICNQGNPPDYLYCLLSGRVQAYATDARGKKYDVEFMRRGMHFGMISLLTGENHSLSFEAMNDSSILKIEKNDFHNLINSIPQLGVAFSQSLSQRLRRRTVGVKSIFESTIISIYSPVKGTGSSTYAVHLALSLQRETKKKVILVHIASLFQSQQEAFSTKREAAPEWKRQGVRLKDIVDDYEKIRPNITSGQLNIDLLNVSFDSHDISLISQISQFVTFLVNDYHYVVVDLPDEMGDVVLKTLTQSDLVQLITLDKPEDLKMTRQVINELEEELKEKFSEEKIQVIINNNTEGHSVSFEEVNKEIDYNVYAKLPYIGAADLAARVDCAEMSVTALAEESEYIKAITKVARQIGKVLVGLVLGGGAALGISHIGVLRVFEKEKIPVDIVVGSSMGALIGSFWVTGKKADDIEKLARQFETFRGMLKLVDPVFPISGFIKGRAIKRWLTRHLGDKTFYATDIPFKVVAYDLARRQEMVINSGLLVDAVAKSIAIPGLINPVLENEKVIIDGGVLNPLPTNVLAAMGINKIIAVNVLQSPEHVTKGYLLEQQQVREKQQTPFRRAPWHFVSFRIGRFFKKIFAPSISDIIVCSLQASEYVIAEQSGQHADVVIHPDLAGFNWFELYRVDELIKRGEDAAQKALDKVKTLIKE